MTLTRKLTSFWIVGLVTTTLLLLLTSALVLRQVADEHQRQRLSALLAEVATTASQPQASYDAWLPPLLKLQEVRAGLGDSWSQAAINHFTAFLRDWLLNHVIKEDMLMKPWLTKHSPRFVPR